jgi:predicted HTH transcriptional regulator
LAIISVGFYGENQSVIPDAVYSLQAEIKAFVTSLEGDNVGKNVGKQLNERQRVIVDLIAKDSTINIPQMSGKTAATERTIQRDLQFLQKLGILRRVGGRKEGRWEIIGN